MRKVFLFPVIDEMKGTPNPYIFNFQQALSKKCFITNTQAPNRGVLNLFLYFFQTDIYIFNWVEYISEKKFGKLQVFLFTFFIYMSILFKKKIIWILHNKTSHHRGTNLWSEYMFGLLMRYSDNIITHSSTGLDFVKDKYPHSADKVSVINHPVKEIYFLQPSTRKPFDFLIWGSIFPYKGIDRFLSYLKENAKYLNYKVLILGKCFNEEYKKKLESLMPVNVQYHDKIFSLEEIATYSTKAKFTLFTYKSDSVISSGSLIDTIRMGNIIIGPNYAAFKDLKNYSFIKTYDSFDEVFSICDEYDPDMTQILEDKVKFCKENDWDGFIEKLGMAF